jgi:HAD superfamily hydrolase (TIGR01509 family)
LAAAEVDEFVLSFEVGAAKPDRRIFTTALERLGVAADEALMIGDSEENDGAAREVGCSFALVDPLPIADRPTGLIDALRERGVAL